MRMDDATTVEAARFRLRERLVQSGECGAIVDEGRLGRLRRRLVRCVALDLAMRPKYGVSTPLLQFEIEQLVRVRP